MSTGTVYVTRSTTASRALPELRLMSVRKSGHLKDFCWRGLKEFAGSVKVTQTFDAASHWVVFPLFCNQKTSTMNYD